MPEQQPDSNNGHETQATEEDFESIKLFTDTLDAMESIPDIADNLEATVQTAEEMINTLGLGKEFFEDRTRVTLFALTANKAARSESYAQREYAADIALALAKDHTTEVAGLEGLMNTEVDEAISDEERLAVYEKYTNRDLSQRLEEAIKGSLIADTREKLGLDDPEKDDPFTVRVLSISDEYNLGGISPGDYEQLLEESGLEGYEAISHADDVIEDSKHWKEGLRQRYYKFFEEQGMEPFHGAAWVTDINGETQLCVLQPAAEKVLDKEDVVRGGYYSDDDWDNDRHLIAHEFVHTQRIMSKNEIGISIEELRAEELAHGASGYNEIKTFFTDIGIFSGTDVRASLHEVFENGGNASDVYVKLAQELGADTVLDIVSVLPESYMRDLEGISELRRSISLATGGVDAIIKRIHEKSIRNGNGSQVEARIKKSADFFEKLEDPATILAMRSNYGLRHSTGIIMQELEKRKAA